VLDPVVAQRASFDFYRMDARLQIDLPHLLELLQSGRVAVVVIIHFFGWPDLHYHEAVAAAHAAGALVLEDQAHSMLTDLVGGQTGTLGDASIYSLHKLLPVSGGGALVTAADTPWGSTSLDAPEVQASEWIPWEYDLAQIAQRRRSNVEAWSELIRPLSGEVDPLHPTCPEGVVPQTYPVVIRNASRDRLYDLMNAEGCGVVSLYHTLVAEIPKASFPQSFAVSSRIMNLPVHQDIEPEMLEPAARLLTFLLQDADIHAPKLL
jgi:dTDP-4-amino-4,6-dideoxygalactose transaminase